MNASAAYPIYTAEAVASDGTKYELKHATLNLSLEEKEGELAEKVTISLANVQAGDKLLSSLLALKMRLFVYANDGSQNKEVFRGYIWDKASSIGTEKEIKIVAYTNLIYLQKSKDCMYFTAGKYTDAIIKSICSKWGISISYDYDSIKHSKMPLNNKYIADMIIEPLNAVKKQKGTKYNIRSVQDNMQIRKTGTNTEIYTFQKNGSILSTKSEESLDGIITRVAIYGNEDDDERREIAATVNGDTSSYGTLQEVVLMSGNTTLSEAKAEAKEILEEKGKPKPKHTVELPDVPWVHKGDCIYIYALDLSGLFLVNSVTHEATSKTMSVEVEKA